MEEKLCTPQKAYEIPILEVLVENGGKLSQNEVLQRIEEKFKFFPGDKSLMSSGCIRWHNNACWARFKMVKKGEIDNSVRGIWIITEKGRERYEVEKDSYDQSNFKPSHIRESNRARKQKTKLDLVHPDEVTANYLQEWGNKRGLNLFELGFDGVKDVYTEYYYKNSKISDREYLEIIHSIFRDIKAFIKGNESINPKN